VHPDLLRKPGGSIDVLSTRRLTTSWPSAMWSNWSSESENPLPDADVTRFEGLTFAIAAAEAGMGSVLAPGPSVWDALAEGKLVAPLGFHRREGDWALSWHSDQTSGVHLAALRWFEQEFSESASRAGV
jgi:DNA-binding transcriptional LysR family regulator